VAHVDNLEELAAGLATVRAAADAAGAIRAWTHVQTWHNPRIAALARALDSARHSDPAAAAAWQDRADDRMRDAQLIVERLCDEGRLHPSWTTNEAAALLWELTSFHVWDDLVTEAKVSPAAYAEIITTAALSALGAPLVGPDEQLT
jgi:hypothetical protein